MAETTSTQSSAQSPQAATSVPPPLDLVTRPYVPEWKSLWRRFVRNRSARIGGVIVLVYIVIALTVPLLDDYNARRDSNLPARFTPPTLDFPLDADDHPFWYGQPWP
ncbi:MAG: hypothetical protein M5R40_09115 [Anaerolineae bacterium]|nr:hypothetical protein [Anaerolineae bacterium]